MSSITGASSWTTFAKYTPDFKHYNFWDATFVHICDVSVSTTLLIDSSFESNPFSIADVYLDDANLYWTILMYNGLNDPIQDLASGTTILIPDKTELLNLLNSNESNFTADNSRIVL